ncbi:hypothetical protein STEG23_017738, partial [Scotinomys teguina]
PMTSRAMDFDQIYSSKYEILPEKWTSSPSRNLQYELFRGLFHLNMFYYESVALNHSIFCPLQLPKMVELHLLPAPGAIYTANS